jgi:hypothetical protein
MSPNVVLVFAGNAREAEFYRWKKGLAPSKVQWVTSPRQLQGIQLSPKDKPMPWVGTFWERKDAEMLEQCAMARGITLEWEDL